MIPRFLMLVSAAILTVCCFVTGAAQTTEAVHVIVAVQGQASVKRQGWAGYAPALFGTLLRRGDLLQLDDLSQVKVVCADLTVTALNAPTPFGGVPCPATRQPALRYQGSAVISTRGYGAISFPLVLSPRNTKLLAARPMLRWTAVEGTTAYWVIVRGRDLDWRREVNGKTELVYPEYAPPLKPGNDYKLIVVAGKRQSDEEAAPGMGFALLDPKEAKEVLREEQRISDLHLPDAPAHFLRAHVYAAHGLHAEAIELLEGMTKMLKEPAPLRLLGDLYQTVGLSRQAEKSYLSALELSRTAGDEEGQTLAHRVLGQIYEAVGNKNLTAQHLRAALELANRLGDRQTAGWLEQRLAALK